MHVMLHRQNSLESNLHLFLNNCHVKERYILVRIRNILKISVVIYEYQRTSAIVAKLLEVRCLQ
jgi:hypothetical protein